MPIFFSGLMLGLSLFMALGPQNIFLIRQGALKKHAFLSVVTCFICDVILLTMSVVGLHEMLQRHPSLCHWLAWFGGAFLLFYGLISILHAFQFKAKKVSIEATELTKKQIFLLAIGFSLLNPHAIIDALVLIGGSSSQYPDHPGVFLMGVLTSSLVWFSLLTSTAYFFADFLRKPKVWQRVELISGVVLIGLGIQLIFKASIQGI